MTTSRTHLRRHLAALATVGGLALLAACGDDTSDAPVASAPAATSAPVTAAETTAPPTTAAPVDQTEPSTTENAAVAPVVVSAADYRFDGLPTEVAAGTQFQLGNASTVELHEMVAVRIADGDDRPIAEIITNDLGSLFASAPSFVLLAAPGESEQITAVGDGTLTEPGRYALVCMIPTGIDPLTYLNAAAESGDGPPQVEGGGAPHVFNGMFAELTVTAAD